MIRTFSISTSDTPETAASPTEDTMIVSARPTVIESTCSSTSGQISFFSAALGNSSFSVGVAFFLFSFLLMHNS